MCSELHLASLTMFANRDQFETLTRNNLSFGIKSPRRKQMKILSLVLKVDYRTVLYMFLIHYMDHYSWYVTCSDWKASCQRPACVNSFSKTELLCHLILKTDYFKGGTFFYGAEKFHSHTLLKMSMLVSESLVIVIIYANSFR